MRNWYAVSDLTTNESSAELMMGELAFDVCN